MKVYFSGDHAGFELKKQLMDFVSGLGYEIEDMGPKSFDSSDDYPDFVIPMAKTIVAENIHGGGEAARGIIVAGSGEGEAIAVNRLKGIRAAVYHGKNLDVVKVTREHNNSNVLSLGSRFVEADEAKSAVKIWLDTAFTKKERHVRRLQKIDSGI